MSNILAIFAKHPEAGRVKTRLAAATSPAFAAQVADALLGDSLDRLAQVPAERWLVFDPADAESAFAARAQGRYHLTPQGVGDLGARLAKFLRQHLRTGGERIVIVGADSPTLPLGYIDQAFGALESVNLVLGPASDGGYYLVGCTERVPPIFENIAWSQATVLRDTIARLDDATRLGLLPPWYDVDTLADWQMLQGHVAALDALGQAPYLRHTRALVG
jgi:rSAM/selenodomain-associated transferase 1